MHRDADRHDHGRHYLIQQLEDLALRAEVPRDIDLHPSVGQPRRVDDSELRDRGVRARLAPTDHFETVVTNAGRNGEMMGVRMGTRLRRARKDWAPCHAPAGS